MFDHLTGSRAFVAERHYVRPVTKTIDQDTKTVAVNLPEIGMDLFRMAEVVVNANE